MFHFNRFRDYTKTFMKFSPPKNLSILPEWNRNHFPNQSTQAENKFENNMGNQKLKE